MWFSVGVASELFRAEHTNMLFPISRHQPAPPAQCEVILEQGSRLVPTSI